MEPTTMERTDDRILRLESRADTHDDEIQGVRERLTRVEGDTASHAKLSDGRHAEVLAKLARLDDGIHISPRWVPFVVAALFGGSAVGSFSGQQMTSPTAQHGAP